MSDHTTAALAAEGHHPEDHHSEEHHPLGDNLLLKVYTALIILTGITVAASVYFPGQIGIAVAMVVTPLKASLILMYFMHLKYERPVFVIMFLVAVAILAVVMGLTFFDYLYR